MGAHRATDETHWVLLISTVQLLEMLLHELYNIIISYGK